MNVTGTALHGKIRTMSSRSIGRWSTPRVAEPGRIVSAGLRRFDRLFNLIVGGFGILYSLQTADSFMADVASFTQPLGVVVVALVGLSALAGLGPILAPAMAGRILLLGAAAYGIALLSWAWTVTPPVSTDPMPWLVAMWPVAAAYLARGARSRVAPIVIATMASGAASAGLQVRGDVAVSVVAVDFLFMTGIALVLVLLLGTVRSRVEAVARVQQHAVDNFATAQLDDATEQERARTDALLHDSVLTTFLSAASSSDEESEELSSRMAANSLRVLMHVNAVGRSEQVLPFGQVLSEHSEQLGIWLRHFDDDLSAVTVVMLPDEVSRALVGMLEQAAANSVQHADGATRRTIRAHQLGPDGIRIVIEDDGCGFDRVAIANRGGGRGREASRALRTLEGRVDFESTPGVGTRVVLSWGSVAIVGTEILTDEPHGVLP